MTRLNPVGGPIYSSATTRAERIHAAKKAAKPGEVLGKSIILSGSDSKASHSITPGTVGKVRIDESSSSKEEALAKAGETIENDIKVLEQILPKETGTSPPVRAPATQAADYNRTILREANLEEFYAQLSEEGKSLMNQGLEFLDSVIPFAIVKHQDDFGCTNRVKRMRKMGSFFLNALATEIAVPSSNSSLLISYKANLLQSSKELLIHVDKNLTKSIKTIRQDPERKAILPADVQEVKELFDRWNIELNAQKGQLDIDSVKYGISFVSGLISAISFPVNSPLFRIIPSQVALQVASFALSGLSSTLKIFRILVLGFEVFRRNKQTRELGGWIKEFRLQKAEFQANRKAELDLSGGEPVGPVSEKQALKIELAKFFETSSLEKIRIRTAKMGISIPEEIKTKSELREKMNSDPAFKSGIEDAYVHFRLECEEFDKQIQSAKELSVKMETTRDKKIFLLKPRLEEIKTEVKEMQFDSFAASMKKIEEIQKRLDEVNAKTPATPEARLKAETEIGISRDVIEEELARWNLIEIPSKDSHQSVFNTWIASRTDNQQLAYHVDRQSVIDVGIKGSVNELLGKKHRIEGMFGQFKLGSACLYLSVAASCLTIAATLTAISTFLLPIAAMGTLLLLLTVGSSVVTVGLVGASLYLGMKYTPQGTIEGMVKLLPVRMFYVKVRQGIRSYRHDNRTRKLAAVASFLDTMDLTIPGRLTRKDAKKYRAALENLAIEKQKCKESQNKLEEWDNRLATLQKKYDEAGWKDLDRQVMMPRRAKDAPNFRIAPDPRIKFSDDGLDTMNRLLEALTKADLDLLSDETKYLLEVQLGLDLKEMQKMMKKNPEEFRTYLGDQLKHFFSLTDYEFNQFIAKQRALSEKGIIPSF